MQPSTVIMSAVAAVFGRLCEAASGGACSESAPLAGCAAVGAGVWLCGCACDAGACAASDTQTRSANVAPSNILLMRDPPLLNKRDAHERAIQTPLHSRASVARDCRRQISDRRFQTA